MEHVIVTASGRLVGVDRNSGGYPYLTDTLLSAKLWPSFDTAENYIATFHKQANAEGWRACRVKVEV